MLTRRLVIQSGLATIAMPAVLRAQTLSGQITLMSYAGIFQDNYTKTVIEPFQPPMPFPTRPSVPPEQAPGGAPTAGKHTSKKALLTLTGLSIASNAMLPSAGISGAVAPVRSATK